MGKCNTCDDGMIRPPYWRNGNMGFKPYPWGAWQPVIPSLYWQAISPEQAIHDLYCYVENLLDYSNKQTDWIGENRDKLDELERLFEQFKESGFDDYYAQQVSEWINNNLEFIFRHTIKQIYFALDDSGHLIAFIPESWSDINFYTPLDYENQETYGHLQILLNDVVPYIEEDFEIVRTV